MSHDPCAIFEGERFLPDFTGVSENQPRVRDTRLTNLSRKLMADAAVPPIPFAALRVSLARNNTEHAGDERRYRFWQVMKRVRNKFQPGAQVKWSWGEHTAHGVVRKVFTHRIERTMKGTTVTRAADKKNPAYLIEQDDGDNVLKSHSELHAA